MRGDPKYTPAQLDELRARNPVDDYAGGLVALRATKRGQWTHAGPCPLCSQRTNSRSAGRFECNYMSTSGAKLPLNIPDLSFLALGSEEVGGSASERTPCLFGIKAKLLVRNSRLSRRKSGE
jgi:hypothetical protein